MARTIIFLTINKVFRAVQTVVQRDCAPHIAPSRLVSVRAQYVGVVIVSIDAVQCESESKEWLRLSKSN